ncbi:IS91 family transposase [Synoicihabitans lomoniglobus]|uniref:IS91 family transposase n=1 Tax=Synoicihabitans lomoniglobus TaxID=2909285 RepID=A0AAF0CQ44_9BACT|nr:IS91 family transposase [Opitutaceae bacterium LMO-M01]
MSALAEWLGAQAPGYACTHAISPAQRRALAAIARCRTPEMGGRVYRCAHCTKHDFAYHSCHHRSCPRCGGARTAAWTQRQRDRLLPVPYFMVTFTLPAPLRAIFAAEPKVMIDLLFGESARALQTIASLPKHLGADLGMTGVLHTWGRQMQLHPHVHFIVPGGGLAEDGTAWRHTRKPEWLVPSAPVAARFRQGMAAALRVALPGRHAQVPDSCWRQPWVVDIQHVGSGEAAIKYLARYVQRTAISDERIRTMDAKTVRFGYRDSASGEHKECTLDAAEFMRRYLQHVLPTGVHRVRHFGWEHPAAWRRRRVVETLLAVEIVVRPKQAEDVVQWHLVCPHCQAESLRCVGTLPRVARSPPFVPRAA